MRSDALNALVTSAIWRAEQLEGLRIESALQAWSEVSSLEEEIAKTLPISDAEGRIARRGAVRAALKAGNYSRAQELADSYSAERGATKVVRRALREMIDADAKDLESRFRFASKNLRAGEARQLAHRLHEAGAFGLAAA